MNEGALPPADPAPRRRSMVAPLLLGAALLVLAVVAIQRALAPRAGEPEGANAAVGRGSVLADFGEVVDFTFVDQKGRPFTRKDLAGRVWVIDFFFTTCAGPCIDLTSKMRTLYTTLAADADLGFLSVSVDPRNDTPSALASYARSVGGDSDRWRWLTGDEKEVAKLCKSFFAAYGDRDAAGAISHSTRIHVVDRDGHLRAIHDTQLEGEWLPAILHSVKLLLEQPGSKPAAR